MLSISSFYFNLCYLFIFEIEIKFSKDLNLGLKCVSWFNLLKNRISVHLCLRDLTQLWLFIIWFELFWYYYMGDRNYIKIFFEITLLKQRQIQFLKVMIWFVWQSRIILVYTYFLGSRLSFYLRNSSHHKKTHKTKITFSFLNFLFLLTIQCDF